MVSKKKNITKKNNKPSTQNNKDSKRRAPSSKESPWIDDYLDCFHLRLKPVTEAFLERISQELVTWAKTNKKAYKVSQFFSEKNISYTAYHGWSKKYPRFGAAYSLAKSIIGDRREVGALERKLDAGTVIQMMPFYDPEWHHMMKERAEVKAKSLDKSSGGTQFVVMEKFELEDQEKEAEQGEPVTPSLTPEEVAERANVRKDNRGSYKRKK